MFETTPEHPTEPNTWRRVIKYFAIAAFTLASILPASAEQLAAFDVAEDITRFVHAEAPVFDDGLPAYGNPFVTQGYIYPAGTLDGGVEGTLADGSPAFPDAVLGVWTCDGYFVGDGFHTETGDVVISRQIFQFTDGSLLVTHGAELIDLGVSVTRAITGGAGDYAAAGPSVTQTLLGMSDGYGARLRMALGDVGYRSSLEAASVPR